MIRLICYDITEDKVRTRLSRHLEDHDFTRLQFSVFAGRIAPGRWQKFWKELERFYSKQCKLTDRIHSHVIDKDEFQKMAILGEELDSKWILQEIDVWFA